jgi:hypothetical protein
VPAPPPTTTHLPCTVTAAAPARSSSSTTSCTLMRSPLSPSRTLTVSGMGSRAAMPLTCKAGGGEGGGM